MIKYLIALIIIVALIAAALFFLRKPIEYQNNANLLDNIPQSTDEPVIYDTDKKG